MSEEREYIRAAVAALDDSHAPGRNILRKPAVDKRRASPQKPEHTGRAHMPEKDSK